MAHTFAQTRLRPRPALRSTLNFERLYDRTDGDSPTRFQGVNPNRGPPDS